MYFFLNYSRKIKLSPPASSVSSSERAEGDVLKCVLNRKR